MGIFPLNVRTVTRSAGRRAIAAAAYCSRAKLWDVGLRREVDFSAVPGLEHSEILLPSGAPGRWADRATLWNEVEAIETRENAQLAMEIEALVPGEIDSEGVVELARQFIGAEFPGKAIDLNIHFTAGADGRRGFYMHALLPMREIGQQGFGMKPDRWHGPTLLARWRKFWVQLLNERALEAGSGLLVRAGADAARGRCLDALFEESGADRSIENIEIAWRNGERLLAEPGLALAALTRRSVTFTRSEMSAFARHNTVGDDQYGKVLARIESSVDLVRLPEGDRFSARSVITRDVAARREVEVAEARGAASDFESRWTLGEALALWEAAGLRVRGVGQTYEAAKAFEKKTGIKSVGVHGLLGRWHKNQDRLSPNDVLVVNDATQLSLRQKEWMLKAARAAAAHLTFLDGDGLVEIDGRAIGLDAEQLVVFGG